MGPLIANSADYSAAALVLLVACKGLAYGASMSSFRGGPIFPAMFLGAAGGVALSHLPGAAHGSRRGHGHRCDDRGDARATADRGPAGHPALAVRRARGHASRDRRGVRGVGEAP